MQLWVVNHMATDISRSMNGAVEYLSLTMFITVLLYLSSIYIGMYYSVALQSEFDVCADIYRVVDGDTFDAFPVGRVRLADIDAPELGTSEGEQAKQALSNLVSRYGSRVYLDVDDIYIMDRYNRIVAVAYLRYNKTHIINVNRWLIDNGYATIADYPNEFNPYTWTLYIYLPYDPCGEKTITATATKTITITSTITSTATIVQTAIQIITSPVTMTRTVTSTSILPVTTTLTTTATITSFATTTTATTTSVQPTTVTVEKTSIAITTLTNVKTVTQTMTTKAEETIVVYQIPTALVLLLAVLIPIGFALGYMMRKRY